MYKALFSRKAAKVFLKIPIMDAKGIKEAIVKLQQKPDMHGIIKLKKTPVGFYRYRAGDYRIIFDIDHQRRILEILDIARRSEHTYNLSRKL